MAFFGVLMLQGIGLGSSAAFFYVLFYDIQPPRLSATKIRKIKECHCYKWMQTGYSTPKYHYIISLKSDFLSCLISQLQV